MCIILTFALQTVIPESYPEQSVRANCWLMFNNQLLFITTIMNIDHNNMWYFAINIMENFSGLTALSEVHPSPCTTQHAITTYKAHSYW